MMIEDWSGGYYRSRMHVQEYSDGPVIEQKLYDFINEKLYSNSNASVMMRVGLDAGDLFGVSAESAIPRDVLALPKRLLDESGKQNVFILKPDHAAAIGVYHG